MSRPSGSEPLSRREREIAALLAEGLTDREIARRLFRSERTVQGHVQSILNKLGLFNRTQVATWFARQQPAGVAGPAPGSTPPPPPSNLPTVLTSFVGRERELAETGRLLQRERLLTITGPGGCGKTRLAVQAASEVVHRYPAGVRFIGLGSVSDPHVVAREVAAAIGDGTGADPLQAVAAQLASSRRPQQALVILDNCEHLIDACAAVVSTLLGASRELTFLCTSRERLHIAGEAVWKLGPLQVPDPRVPPDTETVGRSEAVRLLLERMRQSVPEFELDADNVRDVVQLCHRLDGIPLALELAAARADLMSFDELVRHLEGRLSLITVRGAPGRHQTLGSTIGWSYDLLSEAEQRLMRRLAVFAGGFTVEAAEAVCGDAAGVDGQPVFDLLASLANKSLVMPVPPRRERYRFLETIRRYALERLTRSGELETMRLRHLAFFQGFAERAAAGMGGAGQPAWLDQLSDDHDNLRAALDAGRGQDLDGWLAMVLALDRFWQIRGHHDEGRERIEEVLAASAGTAPSALRARALNAQAGLAWQQGDLTHARGRLESSLAMWRELDDRPGALSCLVNLAVIAATQADWEAARGWNEQSLELARALGREQSVAIVLANLGLVTANLGEYGTAQAHLEEGLAIMERLADSMWTAVLHANLGMLAVFRGRDEEAAGRYTRSLRILQRLGARQNVAECLEGLAGIAARRGLPERALTLAGAAEGIREIGGATQRPWSRRLVDGFVEDARRAVGPASARRWADGRNLTESAAIALALEGQGEEKGEETATEPANASKA